MEELGTIKTSISLPISLWNDIQKEIQEDEMSFSRWVQSSSRLMLKTRKMRNVKEFLDSMDVSEFEILKKEIKKRG